MRKSELLILVTVFRSYECFLDDSVYINKFVRRIIENLDGDEENFYLLFYDSVSVNEIVFQNLISRCSVIIGFEVTNSALVHLNDSITP